MKKWTKVLSAFVVATVMSASMATAVGCGGDDDKHEHNYATTWTTDANKHWHECLNDGCDAKIKDEGAHVDAKINGTDTAGEDGLCDVCDYKIKDVTPPTPDGKVTVTFVTPEGATTVEAKTIDKGGKVSKPEDPTKPDHTFVGWFTDDGTFLNEFNFDTAVNANISIYAKFTPNAVTPPDEDPTIVDGKITNKAQLLAFRQMGEITEGNYTLEADIDLEGVEIPAPNLVLAGTATFDGKGHMIMNGAYAEADSKTGLLFKSIKGASVTDVKFLNCSVTSGNESAGMLAGTVESKDGTAAEASKATISKIEFNSCSINSTGAYGGFLYGRNEKAAYIDISEITTKNGATVVCSQYGGLLGGESVTTTTLIFKNLHIDGKFTSSSNGSFIAGRTRGGNVTIENAVIKAEAIAGNGEGQNGLFVGGAAIDKLTLKNILIVKTDNYYICKTGMAPKASDYSGIYAVNEGEEPVKLLYTKATATTDAVVGHTAGNGTNSVAFLTEKGFDFENVWMAEGDGYRLKAASTNIKSEGATLNSMKVSTVNAKLRYKIGETQLSTEGLLVMGVYSDGVQLVLSEGETADYTVDASGVDWTTAGKYEITVKGVGNDITAKYEIEVVAQTGFVVYQDRMAHVYLEGATLDTANLSVKSTWTDGKEETLKLGADYTITGYDLNVAGQYTAKINNGNFPAQDIEINVVKYIPVPIEDDTLGKVVYVNVDKDYAGVNGEAVKGIVNFTELGDAIKYLESCKLEDSVTKVVYVAEGVYAEHIKTALNNLTLIGKGADKTVITCSNVQSTVDPLTDKQMGLNENATLIVSGENFKAYKMAIRNDFDYPANGKTEGSPQGTALMINGDKAVVADCLLYGNQDTLYLKSGRSYFKNTEIQGNIDFIFGEAKGLAYFDHCIIRAINKAGEGKQEKNNGYVTAMKATAADKPDYGYIFDGCEFTDDGTLLDGSMSLGRPWGAAATVAMVNCSFTKAYSTLAYGAIGEDGKAVKPRWYEMSSNKPQDADFKEFGSTGEGAITEAVLGGSIMDAAAAQLQTKTNIFAATNGKITWADGPWDCDEAFSALTAFGGAEFVAPDSFAYDTDIMVGDSGDLEGKLVMTEGKDGKFGVAAGPWNSNDKTVTITVGDETIVSYENGILSALKAGETTITISKDGLDDVVWNIVVQKPSGTEKYDDVSINIADAITAGALTLNTAAHDVANATIAEGIVLNTTGNKTKITEHKNTIEGVSFTHRVVLKGEGNYFAITTKGEATVKVYVANANADANRSRDIGLYSDTAGKTPVTGTTVEKVFGKESKLLSFAVSDAGTYYLESVTNELCIYRIDIVYPEVSAPSFENVTMKVSDVITAGTLTADSTNKQTLSNITIAEGIVFTTTETKIDAHTNTVGGVDFTHRIVLGKPSSTKPRNFAITTEGACTIKVYVANTSGKDDTRNIGLYTDAVGTTMVTGTQDTALNGINDTKAQLVELTVTGAGTYYLVSTVNELAVYQIEIVYNA